MMKFILIFIFSVPLIFDYKLLLVVLISLFLMFFCSFNLNFFFCGLSFMMGCDFVSFYMILLSLWIIFLMFMASELVISYEVGVSFSFFLFLLNFSLFMTFIFLGVFLFYMFFEVSLIFTLILILGWGNQPERIQAGLYMLMYALLASLPMLLSLFILSDVFHSYSFLFFYPVDSLFLYFYVNNVFLVKMPIYFLHLWLPKAHVEAPIAGSMILAGVMLKLGGYGLIRMLKIFQFVGLSVNLYIYVMSLFGGVFVSMVCLRQSDMKSLIAYSSVSHMSLVLGGLMVLNFYGLLGSLLMMVAHGLCSSGLFCLSNMIYERTLSRSLFLNKGFINLLPNLSFWWFIFCSFNMSSPPSLNFLGEILLISSIISWSWISLFILMLICFFTASYSLYLYSFSQHGKFYSGLYTFYMSTIREQMVMFFHLFPLLFLVLLFQ